MPITVARLKELLSYDPETGIFSHRVVAKQGRTVGTIDPLGYARIGLEGAKYKSHHLAWLYVHGAWPTMFIDHINGQRADNRIANLRQVSHSVNSQNIKRARRDNATGVLGVTKLGVGYVAGLTLNKKRVYLGYFKTTEAAHEAYLHAKRRLHEGCTI